MKRENFIQILKQICSVVEMNISDKFQHDNMLIPFSMNIISNIDSNLINIMEANKNIIIFRLYYPSITELCINDIQLEDPTVYYLKDRNMKKYSDSLSVVLLTNLSLWIYDNISIYKTSFKEKGAEFYSFTKENYDYLCGDRPQINQIYYSLNSFMIYINSNIEYFLVAKNQLTLDSLQNRIYEIENDGKVKNCSKRRLSLKDKFITDLYKINDGTAQGVIKFRNKEINIKLDTEKEKSTIKDFNTLSKRLKDLLTYFEDNNYKLLVDKISYQVIGDIYQQSNINEVTLKTEYDNFKMSIILDSIEIFPDGFMFIYDIESNLNEKVYVQLNSEYTIEEIIIN